MTLQLIRIHAAPNEIAATKVDVVIQDGAFFLDFSRPLQSIRIGGIGPVSVLLVPVVHQGESAGGFVISVRRGQPYFVDLPKLWKQNYPSKRAQIDQMADNLKIVADFAAQFPEDSR